MDNDNRVLLAKNWMNFSIFRFIEHFLSNLLPNNAALNDIHPIVVRKPCNITTRRD